MPEDFKQHIQDFLSSVDALKCSLDSCRNDAISIFNHVSSDSFPGHPMHAALMEFITDAKGLILFLEDEWPSVKSELEEYADRRVN